MAKSRKLEELIASLVEIRHDPTAAENVILLQQILKSRYSIAVAQAAKLVGEAEIHALIPDLVAGFERFLVNPVETDPGCTAKFRIAEALYKLDYGEEALFLSGIRHVQMEPVWGGKEDKGVTLRGACAMGLVRMNYPHVLVELADLLADQEAPARVAAVRAIAYHETPDGIPLLRLKVRMGDREPQVMSECFAALLKLAPDQSLALVTSFLDAADEQLCEMAALTLGESRLPQVFAILKRWWEQTNRPVLRRSALLGLALLRQDGALEFLLNLVMEGNTLDARDAIAAMKLYQQDEALWQRLQQAVECREDAAILRRELA